ncbi:T9SS type A sorting domain-containing protein [Flavobacterium hibisci]|uniref:T9SS type A sorting domain-containing protein n=1 Tax=Flavobacterium hibisci TaxID=1914462 RepID=UPI001CBC9F0F|nr:T9SS type A sorting domain-containing protein [Flavobacterium hibisci]MBZ4040997.1 T9SS type A sorting domain-containing protein [Flavobacterium hibisci]
MKKTTFLNLLIFLCLTVNFSYAATLYVSTTGDDVSGNGSISSPYKTITKAASMVNSGDTVLVSGGIYIEKNIIPKSSGTLNALIVFKPNPGTGTVTIQHPGVSVSDNTDIFNLSNRNYIWIEGFLFKDFKYGRSSIYIAGGVRGNVVISNQFINLGNAEVGSWESNQVVRIYKSTNNVVRNNYFSNIIGDGIAVNGEGATGNLISENTFIGFKGKLRSWGGSYLFSRTVDIQDMTDGNNVFSFNYSQDVVDGLWLDRNGSSNILIRNVGKNGSTFIFNESRCVKNVIQENIAYGMINGFKSAYYPETGWTQDARWINNVVYNSQVGFQIHKSIRNEFRNNISFNNTQSNIIFSDTAYVYGPHLFRNNLWYSQNITNSIQFKGVNITPQNFQAGVRETGGLAVNPGFNNLTSGQEDFTLSASSPAKSAGEEGVNMGAYAVYGPTAVGWNSNLQTSGPKVSFQQIISKVDRGGQIQLDLKLDKSTSVPVTVDIVAIAGDAENVKDYTLSNTTVTFQPGETDKTIYLNTVGNSRNSEAVVFALKNLVNAQAGSVNTSVLRINVNTIEAEKACSYTGTVESVNNGFSGSGYIKGNTDKAALMGWKINSDVANLSNVGFNYANGTTAAIDAEIYINGSNAGTISLLPTGSWSNWSIAKVNLNFNAGLNILELRAKSSAGLPNVDALYTSSALSAGICGSLETTVTSLEVNYIQNSTVTFGVISDLNWTVSSDQSWLSSNIQNGTNNGTIVLTAQKNPTTQIRKATITVFAKGVESKKIIVTQKANTEINQLALKVDFKSNATQTTETAWKTLVVGDKSSPSISPSTYNAFYNSVKVQPVWLDSPVANNVRSVLRSSGTYLTGLLAPVLENFIAVDSKYANNCTSLAIKLSGLPKGEYYWKSYHHDFNNQSGAFKVTVTSNLESQSDDTVYTVSSGIPSTNTLSGVTQVIKQFKSDGETDVITIKFENTLGFSASMADVKKFVLINGFELVNLTEINDPTLKQLGIVNVNAKNNLDIFAAPNPTNGPFDIYVPINESTAEIEIYNSNGILISKSVYLIEDRKAHLDLGKEPTGIYFIKLKSNPLETIKIIKK